MTDRAINKATGANIPEVRSYEREEKAAGGNTYQTITWEEKLREQ